MKRFLLVALPILLLAGCIKKRMIPAAGPVIIPSSDTVMYYWSFNNFDSSKRSADFGVNPGGTFSYYASYIDSTAGTLLGALPGVDSGSCLRVRNPSDSIVF